MQRMTIDEAFKPTSRTLTPEGFLCVKGIAARTGVYPYLSSELELDGPERIVNVTGRRKRCSSLIDVYLDKDGTHDPRRLGRLDISRMSSSFSWFDVTATKVVDMIIKISQPRDSLRPAELSPGYVPNTSKLRGRPCIRTAYEYDSVNIQTSTAVVEEARAGRSPGFLSQTKVYHYGYP